MLALRQDGSRIRFFLTALVLFLAGLTVDPHRALATDIRVVGYVLEFEDRDEAGFYPTGFSLSDYPQALMTNIRFFKGCDRFNHGWSGLMQVRNNEWYIFFTKGPCNRVALNVFYFKNASGGYWEYRGGGNRMKRHS